MHVVASIHIFKLEVGATYTVTGHEENVIPSLCAVVTLNIQHCRVEFDLTSVIFLGKLSNERVPLVRYVE